MMDPRLLLDLQAPMPPAKIVQRHRQPTHLAVRASCFGKGEGLADLAPVAQATRAVLPLHDPRVDMLIPQQVQHMIEARFPPDHPHVDPRDLAPFIAFFHLAIGQPWGLAHQGTRVSPPPLARRARRASRWRRIEAQVAQS